MGWITRLLQGADAQRSTTRLAREDAKAERAPELDADDSSLGFGRLAEAFPDADLEPVTASDAAAGRPEMGEDYHTQPVGSGRHRTAHREYLEATGGARDGWTAEQEYAADHWAELEYDRQQAELEAKYAAEEPPEGYEPDVREVDRDQQAEPGETCAALDDKEINRMDDAWQRQQEEERFSERRPGGPLWNPETGEPYDEATCARLINEARYPGPEREAGS